MGLGDESLTEFSFNYGLENEKTLSPIKGTVFLATDTDTLHICFESGTWESQKIPVSNPLSVDENGYIYFNGNPIFLPGETEIFNFATPSYRLTKSISFLEISGTANRTHILSTAPTVAELTKENILSAATSGRGVLLSHNKLLTAETTIYGYYRDSSNETLDSIYANLRTFFPVVTARSSNARMTTINLARTSTE